MGFHAAQLQADKKTVFYALAPVRRAEPTPTGGTRITSNDNLFELMPVTFYQKRYLRDFAGIWPSSMLRESVRYIN